MTPTRENEAVSAADAARIEDGERFVRRAWTFVRGAPSAEFLPPADRPEIAICGRSNVGKSSLINALVRHGGLARTSNTPGRTQELNFFAPDQIDLYLVDLPGYGFAKAPKDKVATWTSVIKNYLRGRQTLKRVFLLIDARHGIKDVDHDIMKLLDEAAVTYQVVLTKIDKIKDSALTAVRASTAAAIKKHPAAFPDVIVTSSETGDGLAELRAAFAEIVSTSG